MAQASMQRHMRSARLVESKKDPQLPGAVRPGAIEMPRLALELQSAPAPPLPVYIQRRTPRSFWYYVVSSKANCRAPTAKFLRRFVFRPSLNIHPRQSYTRYIPFSINRHCLLPFSRVFPVISTQERPSNWLRYENGKPDRVFIQSIRTKENDLRQFQICAQNKFCWL